MANSPYPYPALLTDPGYLYFAPLGTALPTPTVVGSVFTDTWPIAWIPLGMTESGTDIDVTMTTSPIVAAEQIEPLAYRTTDRSGSMTFSLKSVTATNLARCLNGAALTVTGTTTTTLTQIDPPAVGTEVRCMIGFESLDSTFRFIAFQCFNSGDIKMSFNKAPANTAIPWNPMFEKPANSQAWRAWTAGADRA